MKKSAKVLLYFGLDCGCGNSLFKSRNPKNNWCLSCIFGARFGGKDRGLSTCKPWSKQAAGWIHSFRTLNSCQIFKIKNQKSKTYSGWCPFKGLSNGTTLMQIQSGRTVPLNAREFFFVKHITWSSFVQENPTHISTQLTVIYNRKRQYIIKFQHPSTVSHNCFSCRGNRCVNPTLSIKGQ